MRRGAEGDAMARVGTENPLTAGAALRVSSPNVYISWDAETDKAARQEYRLSEICLLTEVEVFGLSVREI